MVEEGGTIESGGWVCESERGGRAVAERVKFSRVERALPMWDLTAGRVQRAVCGEAYPAAQPGPGLPDMNHDAR